MYIYTIDICQSYWYQFVRFLTINTWMKLSIVELSSCRAIKNMLTNVLDSTLESIFLSNDHRSLLIKEIYRYLTDFIDRQDTAHWAIITVVETDQICRRLIQEFTYGMQLICITVIINNIIKNYYKNTGFWMWIIKDFAITNLSPKVWILLKNLKTSKKSADLRQRADFHHLLLNLSRR